MKPANRPNIHVLTTAVNMYTSIPQNFDGGVYHCLLADKNLKRRDIKYMVEDAKEKQDKPAIVLGELLLQSSYRQRKMLYKNFKWL